MTTRTTRESLSRPEHVLKLLVNYRIKKMKQIAVVLVALALAKVLGAALLIAAVGFLFTTLFSVKR